VGKIGNRFVVGGTDCSQKFGGTCEGMGVCGGWDEEGFRGQNPFMDVTRCAVPTA
jgi:hypothetical protein